MILYLTTPTITACWTNLLEYSAMLFSVAIAASLRIELCDLLGTVSG